MTKTYQQETARQIAQRLRDRKPPARPLCEILLFGNAATDRAAALAQGESA